MQSSCLILLGIREIEIHHLINKQIYADLSFPNKLKFSIFFPVPAFYLKGAEVIPIAEFLCFFLEGFPNGVEIVPYIFSLMNFHKIISHLSPIAEESEERITVAKPPISVLKFRSTPLHKDFIVAVFNFFWSYYDFAGLFFSLRISDVLNEGVILRTDDISDSCIADAD